MSVGTFILGSFLLFSACGSASVQQEKVIPVAEKEIQLPVEPAAFHLDELYPQLKDKKLALVINQSSINENAELILDELHRNDMHIVKIFAPEHGFRGDADAGAHIQNETDIKTGIPVVSLYGKNKKPSAEQLKGVDIVIFDIQDVGVRFYTYISTLHYVMEACAENNKRLIVLDRPNPNGFYVDGPMLKKGFESFVGMDPIPVVYGMTMGELALMINGEHWLKDSLNADLQIIKCNNYTHHSTYELPVKPSPNLPNARAVFLYPSICFFEGTNVSVGRGTDKQFQFIGSPKLNGLAPDQTLIESKPGATAPPFLNETCYGFDLSKGNGFFKDDSAGLNLQYLITVYNLYPDKANFFLKNNFIDLLAGSDELRHQLEAGKTEDEIKQSWQTDLSAFKAKRKKYLLYTDFDE